MELMIVVVIIMITAALAAPALSQAMADRRANEATHDMVRIGGRARSEAMAYGRAHLLIYSPANNGEVQLWRGRVNLCSANNWGSIVQATCSNADCLDDVVMSSYSLVSQQVVMRPDGVGAGVLWLCFQPDGDMRVMNGGASTGVWTDVPPAGADAVRFQIDRTISGSRTGVSRAVLYPFGGTPRVEQ